MNTVQFFYIRDKKRFPIATVATLRKTVNGVEGVAFGLSVYNSVDKFDRTQAKYVAQARLELRPIFIEAEPGTIRGKILETIAYESPLWVDGNGKHFLTSSKVRRAALRMLKHLRGY